MADETTRDRCPMCGHTFDEGHVLLQGDADDCLKKSVRCPNCDWWIEQGTLIGEWDDCGWDY